MPLLFSDDKASQRYLDLILPKNDQNFVFFENVVCGFWVRCGCPSPFLQIFLESLENLKYFSYLHCIHDKSSRRYLMLKQSVFVTIGRGSCVLFRRFLGILSDFYMKKPLPKKVCQQNFRVKELPKQRLLAVSHCLSSFDEITLSTKWPTYCLNWKVKTKLKELGERLMSVA